MIPLADRLGFAPPKFQRKRIKTAVEAAYGITGELKPLEGERDQNHRLTTVDGLTYVAKVSAENEDPRVVEFQSEALLHIQAKDPRLQVPRICKTLTGENFTRLDKQTNMLRVLTYLQGIPMSSAALDSQSLAINAGCFLGRLAKALADFSHPAERHFLAWDMTNGLLDDDVIWATGGEDIQALESELRPYICNKIIPLLAQQRMQVVHNDGHQDNLLVNASDFEQVVGMIDFGDMIRTALICDLAILCLGFAEQSKSPQQAVANAIAGYHSENPLFKHELDLVPFQGDIVMFSAPLMFRDKAQCVTNGLFHW